MSEGKEERESGRQDREEGERERGGGERQRDLIKMKIEFTKTR